MVRKRTAKSAVRRAAQNVIVCRCEDVTEHDIRKAVRAGHHSLTELKHLLRVGMGHCQGRGCLRNIMRIIEEETGIKPAEQQLPRARPPLKPVPLGLLGKHEAAHAEDR
ncbi:MAG: (2Fe-2S)-binding protein [candidate division WOR-3 bacterium]